MFRILKCWLLIIIHFFRCLRCPVLYAAASPLFPCGVLMVLFSCSTVTPQEWAQFSQYNVTVAQEAVLLSQQMRENASLTRSKVEARFNVHLTTTLMSTCQIKAQLDFDSTNPPPCILTMLLMLCQQCITDRGPIMLFRLL